MLKVGMILALVYGSMIVLTLIAVGIAVLTVERTENNAKRVQTIKNKNNVQQKG